MVKYWLKLNLINQEDNGVVKVMILLSFSFI